MIYSVVSCLWVQCMNDFNLSGKEFIHDVFPLLVIVVSTAGSKNHIVFHKNLNFNVFMGTLKNKIWKDHFKNLDRVTNKKSHRHNDLFT